jgi:hypothetical protein
MNHNFHHVRDACSSSSFFLASAINARSCFGILLDAPLGFDAFLAPSLAAALDDVEPGSVLTRLAGGALLSPAATPDASNLRFVPLLAAAGARAPLPLPLPLAEL